MLFTASDLASITSPIHNWMLFLLWLHPFIFSGVTSPLISWVFIGRTDFDAETPILWLPDVKSWLIWKDPDAGKDWGQEEKGTTEDEMAGWHHRLDGQGFGWTPGVGDGQGGLACCSSWGHKESDMIQQLNWTPSAVADDPSALPSPTSLPLQSVTLLACSLTASSCMPAAVLCYCAFQGPVL